MHLIDAEVLIDRFADSDARMPYFVFALLSLYLAQGPFEFDAAALSRRLENINIKVRSPPQEIAALQTELEKFFVPGPQGWRPRPGVLDVSEHLPAGANAGRPPGDIAGRPG